MTREEAAKILYSEKSAAGAIRWIKFPVSPAEEAKYNRYIEAVDIALDALKPHTPNSSTELMPCGCGGKAKIWPSDLRQATDYEVGCTECAMTTGWVRGKQENAMNVWNTAMGWKGGAE